jgi:deoxyribonuclease V
MKNKLFEEQQEFKQYYDLQNNLRDKVIKQDQLPEIIKYIVGVDVAYNDSSDRLRRDNDRLNRHKYKLFLLN